MRNWLRWISLALATCVPAAPGLAQTTFATLTGTVVDPNGALVPDAAVEATHVASNYAYQVRTNTAGVYTLAQLREGKYTVRVRATGFREFVATDVDLSARDYRRLDAQLALGAVESKVEVAGGGLALIETETARISSVKSDDTIKNLPLNTRSMYSFLQLTPGMLVQTAGNAYLRFAGSRGNQENEATDGSTFNNMYDGSLLPQADFMEGFQEMRVDMANNGAEFGALGQVTFISKAGTNLLHGSAYDYYTAAGLVARNPFSPTRDTYVRHAPGASVGGPVLIPHVYNGKDRTFFFFTYETMRGGAIRQLLNDTVALAPWRQGDFSAPGNLTVKDPTTGSPFPNNIIPASRLSATALKMQDFYFPLPNYGDTSTLQTGNFRLIESRPYDPYSQWATRIDHRFSAKDFVFGRFNWQRQHIEPFEVFPSMGQGWLRRDNRGVNLSYTHTFNGSMLNEFRWGLANNDTPRHPTVNGNQLDQQFGITGLVPNIPDIPGVPLIKWSNLGLTNVSTNYDNRVPGFRNRVQQFTDHFSWFKGRHSVKTGVTLGRTGFADGPANNSMWGNWTFSNRYTGQPYADFLLGLPTTVQRGYPILVYTLHRWSYDFFATDDVKLNSRLTLSLGLRYELKPDWTEENGLLSVFDVATGKIVVPDGSASKISPLFPSGYTSIIQASQAGYPANTLIRTDTNNFAPRIGLAYRPWDNNTVLRAGFGIYYDVVPRAPSAAGSPYVLNEPAYTNPSPNPTVVLPQAWPSSGASGPTNVTLPAGIRTDLRIPYSPQFSFTIEHQQWGNGFRISYIATGTRQGEYAYNINQPTANTQAFINKPRMFPQYPAITYITNGAGHQYNSLTLAMRREMKHGLTYQFSYELSRDIGDLERGASPEDAYNRARERGVWLDVPTHRVTSYAVYQLPFGKGRTFLSSPNRLVDALIGGWQISPVWTMYSGQFLTPQWTGSDPTGTAYTTSATPASVTIRPSQIGNPNLPSDQRSVTHWFDASAFTAPALGYFGSAARGTIKGPGLVVVDLGLSKYFSITERLRVRTEASATNLPNHPNWSNPGVNISTPSSVGVITSVGGVAAYDQPGTRTIRLSLRLEW